MADSRNKESPVFFCDMLSALCSSLLLYAIGSSIPGHAGRLAGLSVLIKTPFPFVSGFSLTYQSLSFRLNRSSSDRPSHFIKSSTPWSVILSTR